MVPLKLVSATIKSTKSTQRRYPNPTLIRTLTLPVGDTAMVKDEDSIREGRKHDLFMKGQSKRIWSELYKVQFDSKWG